MYGLSCWTGSLLAGQGHTGTHTCRNINVRTHGHDMGPIVHASVHANAQHNVDVVRGRKTCSALHKPTWFHLILSCNYSSVSGSILRELGIWIKAASMSATRSGNTRLSRLWCIPLFFNVVIILFMFCARMLTPLS